MMINYTQIKQLLMGNKDKTFAILSLFWWFLLIFHYQLRIFQDEKAVAVVLSPTFSPICNFNVQYDKSYRVWAVLGQCS